MYIQHSEGPDGREKDLDDAKPYLDRAMDMLTKLSGKDDFHTATAILNLKKTVRAAQEPVNKLLKQRADAKAREEEERIRNIPLLPGWEELTSFKGDISWFHRATS